VVEIYLEVADRKTFAMARAWPGWGRSARTEQAALATLAEYHPRYLLIAERAGDILPGPDFEVTEIVAGGGATDFGVPNGVPVLDHERLTIEELNRQIRLFEASHEAFDTVTRIAPEELRKGPRGGGRDTSEIIDHVVESERFYARQIGLKGGKHPIGEIRGAVIERCLELAEHPQETRWPLPYFLRRATWHVVDHLWEIEDKS
jgi:hypothetical protein